MYIPSQLFSCRSGKNPSLVGSREGSSGGLRSWWSKFSGRLVFQNIFTDAGKMSRFKKLTPVPGSGDEVSAEIALGNDLHYKQLVPQVGPPVHLE